MVTLCYSYLIPFILTTELPRAGRQVPHIPILPTCTACPLDRDPTPCPLQVPAARRNWAEPPSHEHGHQNSEGQVRSAGWVHQPRALGLPLSKTQSTTSSRMSVCCNQNFNVLLMPAQSRTSPSRAGTAHPKPLPAPGSVNVTNTLVLLQSSRSLSLPVPRQDPCSPSSRRIYAKGRIRQRRPRCVDIISSALPYGLPTASTA